jgi:phosphoglycerate dehydrogenase-like enzyme
MTNPSLVNVAILDDYQNVALSIADWSPLKGRANVTVFNDHLSGNAEVIERLMPFDVLCVMRERTPLPRSIIDNLPNLKLIPSTGSGNASIDTDDVYDVEPLELTDPLRSHRSILATPHIGYVTRDLYQTFCDDSVSNIVDWLDRGARLKTSL